MFMRAQSKSLPKSLMSVVVFFALLISGCDYIKPADHRTAKEIEEEKIGSIFDAFKGKGSSTKSSGGLFGNGLSFNGKSFLGDSSTSAGVNENLWRSAYEITSVLPISTANRQRGVIETDWYAPPGITHEQMRVVVFIGSGAINPSAVKVNAFRRGFDAQGQVVQTPASETVSEELKKAILRRAVAISNG